MDLAVPKLRQGSYFPGWLLEPRRRAERALTQVVCHCYVEGVSTRRVDDIVKAMGIEGISKSQVSAMAKELDATVEAFRSRPARRRALHVHLARRPDPKSERGRPGGERGRRHRHRREQRGHGGNRSALTSSLPRTGRAGRRSCAAWWPGASRAWPWSLPTTTKA